MAITGVTDIAEITDRLVTVIRNAAGGVSSVSGSMPETVRREAGCQLTFYLFHVAADRNVRNSPTTGSQVQRQRPLGLELYYMLTAFCGQDYAREQLAMTLAMRALHDAPFLRLSAAKGELTIGIEPESMDRLGVLWQAASTPFRCTAVYRVAVAFIAPPDVTPAPAPKPETVTLVADATSLPFAEGGQVLGSYMRVEALHPDSTPAQLKTVQYDLSPATVAPGQRFLLYGAGLNRPETNRLYLLDGGAETDVTAWVVGAESTASRMVVALPAAAGAAPTPGVYQLRAGGALPAARTNATAIQVAAAITGVTNPPLLNAAAAPFTLAGSGFTSGATEVFLETIALTPAAGVPGTGEFSINGAGTEITFRPPAGLAAGRYGVRVRVNGIESAPSWWVVAP